MGQEISMLNCRRVESLARGVVDGSTGWASERRTRLPAGWLASPPAKRSSPSTGPHARVLTRGPADQLGRRPPKPFAGEQAGLPIAWQFGQPTIGTADEPAG